MQTFQRANNVYHQNTYSQKKLGKRLLYSPLVFYFNHSLVPMIYYLCGVDDKWLEMLLNIKQEITYRISRFPGHNSVSWQTLGKSKNSEWQEFQKLTLGLCLEIHNCFYVVFVWIICDFKIHLVLGFSYYKLCSAKMMICF